MRWCSMCLVLAACIVVASKDANAATWKVMGKSDAATYYADVDSAKAVPGETYRSIWTRTEFKNAHAADGKNYRSLRQLVYIDCDHRKMAIKTVHAYKSANGSGIPEFSVTYRDYMLDFMAQPPGTTAHVLVDYMCKK